MLHLFHDRNYEQLLIACFPSKLRVLSVEYFLEYPFSDVRVVMILISRTWYLVSSLRFSNCDSYHANFPLSGHDLTCTCVRQSSIYLVVCISPMHSPICCTKYKIQLTFWHPSVCGINCSMTWYQLFWFCELNTIPDLRSVSNDFREESWNKNISRHSAHSSAMWGLHPNVLAFLCTIP